MSLKKFLEEQGILADYEDMGVGADKVLSGLTEETEAQYSKYRWFHDDMGFSKIVHAIPPEDMLAEGYPWEEWYRDESGVQQHHILYLKKTELCDMTFDCPADDTTHPEPTRDRFWHLYNDGDSRLLYAR